jgi:hypothetical protein
MVRALGVFPLTWTEEPLAADWPDWDLASARPLS